MIVSLVNLKFNQGPRAAHSCELIGNKLYVFGGWNGKKALNDMYVLNLENLQWYINILLIGGKLMCLVKSQV